VDLLMTAQAPSVALRIVGLGISGCWISPKEIPQASKLEHASACTSPIAGSSRGNEAVQRCCPRRFHLGARVLAVVSRGDGASVSEPSRGLFCIMRALETK
jgi:hypothetical protein